MRCVPPLPSPAPADTIRQGFGNSFGVPRSGPRPRYRPLPRAEGARLYPEALETPFRELPGLSGNLALRGCPARRTPCGRTPEHPPLPSVAGDSGLAASEMPPAGSLTVARPVRCAVAACQTIDAASMETGKNRGGRPPKAAAEKRSAEVKFHVTPEVKERLQREAKTAGTDLAAYCREKVLTGQPPRRIPPAILAAVAELARQGNNLNQLARIANAQKGMDGVAGRLLILLDFYEKLARFIKRHCHDSENSNG